MVGLETKRVDVVLVWVLSVEDETAELDGVKGPEVP